MNENNSNPIHNRNTLWKDSRRIMIRNWDRSLELEEISH